MDQNSINTSFTYLFQNKKRGLIVLFLLLGMFVLFSISTIRFFYLKSELPKPISVFELQRVMFDPTILFIGILNFFLYITTIVFYLLWFRKAYENMDSLGIKQRYSANMAVGAWFIPVFHWIAPIQIMLGLYRNTEKVLIENQLTKKKRVRYVILFIWWLFYILSGLFTVYRIIYTKSRLEDPMSTQLMTESQIISIILNIVLVVTAILVVQNYRKMEIKLHQLKFVKQQKSSQFNEILDEQF